MAVIRYSWNDETNAGVTGHIDVKTSGRNIPGKDVIDETEIVSWQLNFNGVEISSANGDELHYISQQFGNTLLATKKGLFLAGAGSSWQVTAYGEGEKPIVPYTLVRVKGFYQGNVASIRYTGRTGDGGPYNKETLFDETFPMENQGRYQFGDWVQIGESPRVLDDTTTPTPSPTPTPTPSPVDLVTQIKDKLVELTELINEL